MTSDSIEERPDLSVIMVNWNALQLTTQALRSLRAYTAGIAYEVILVDNGSTKDDSAAELPEMFPWVRFVALTTNSGFAHPNNLGMRLARGRYVLLLNNDTIQIENALGKAVQYMDRNSTIGAIGITHRNHDAVRSLQPSFYRFPRPAHEALLHLGLTSPGLPTYDERDLVEKEVDWVVGSFLLIRRECLDDVGLLDERFFLYDEDIDWCHRAHTKGWSVRFWPGAELVHLGNGTMSWMTDKSFMHYRSHLTYLAKNHSAAAAVSYYLSLSLRLGASTLWQTLRWLVGRGTASEVRDRIARQLSFLRLAATRTGVDEGRGTASRERSPHGG